MASSGEDAENPAASSEGRDTEEEDGGDDDGLNEREDLDSPIPVEQQQLAAEPLVGMYWFARGDVSCAFALVLDNFANMSVFASILISGFGLSSKVVYSCMFPGTALGVVLGDLAYFAMALLLGRESGRADVTAIPLGLDAPTSAATAYTVIGPSFLASRARGLDVEEASLAAWGVGTAALLCIGLLKVLLSFLGGHIQRGIPTPALLGSLCAIAVPFLLFLPFLELLREPVVGLLAMFLILFCLVAKIALPLSAPPVFVSVGLGTLCYYLLVLFGWSQQPFRLSLDGLVLAAPLPSLSFVDGMPVVLSRFLPVTLPFALLTVVGGIAVAEHAQVIGEHYSTRGVLLAEAAATVIGALFGGVVQSVPYMGHAAYKKMGGRAAYVLISAVAMAVAGCTGAIQLLLELIPLASLTPVLVFVAMDMLSETFRTVSPPHFPVVSIALTPCLAQLILVFVAAINPALAQAASSPDRLIASLGLSFETVDRFGVLVMLSNGNLLSSVLWGCVAFFLIERRRWALLLTLLICALLTVVGIIHSVDSDGAVYLEFWTLSVSTHLKWTAGYGLMAAMALLLSFTPAFNLPMEV